MVRKAIFLGGLVCVVALVLLVWWSGGREKDESRSPTAGKQEAVGSDRPAQSRRSLGERMRLWGFLGESRSAGREPRDVEEAVRRTFRAYNRQDLPAFKAGWTEKGFQQAYGLSKEKATDFGLLSLLSFRPYTIGEFSNTAVAGKSAATEVGLTYGEVQESHRMSLLREGDAWKIDHDEKLDLISRDVTVIDAKLNFFIIELERTRLVPGTVAFKITNADTREHEFIVKRITESESEQTIGKTKPLKPDENQTLILNLDAGRYVVLCNMLSRDGVPYSYGMRTEFLVE